MQSLQRKWRKRRACMARRVALFLCICVSVTVSRGEGEVAYVGGKTNPRGQGLVRALLDEKITHIILMNDTESSAFSPFAKEQPALKVRRNVTIQGPPGVPPAMQPLWDMQFLWTTVELCSSCVFTIRNLSVANERRGNGASVDFFVGQPGSALVFVNANRQRPACTSIEATIELSHSYPRSVKFPKNANGTRQQVVDSVDKVYKGHSFPNSLQVVDFSFDVPSSYQEGRGKIGGFALAIYNTTRLCFQTVSHSCLMLKSPDACVNELIDKMLADVEGAAAVPKKHPGSLTVVVPVVVSVVVLALGLAGLLLWMQRKARRCSSSSSNDKKVSRWFSPGSSKQGNAAGFGSGSAGRELADKMEAGVLVRHSADAAPENTRDWQPLLDTNGWHVTSKSTAPLVNVVGDDNIQFGVLLGAGSFGKVYRGYWAGREVAIKVIEHDRETSAAVENEVQLMLSFRHPNIVRAYHFVTYTHTANDTDGGSSGGFMLAAAETAAGGVQGPAAAAIAAQQARNNTYPQLPCIDTAGSNADSYRQRKRASKQGQSASSAAVAAPATPPVGAISPAMKHINASAPGCSSSTCESNLAADTPPTTWHSDKQQQQGLPVSSGGSSDQLGKSDQHEVPAAGFAEPRRMSSCPLPGVAKPLHNTDAANSAGVSGSGYWGSSSKRNIGEHNTPDFDCRSSWPGIIDSASASRFNGTPNLREVARAKTWLVQEFCDCGTLSNLAAKWEPKQEDDEQMLQRLLLLQDAARGLAALHSKCVVHGDLNARNVLISSCRTARFGVVAKLADLGLSRVIKQHSTHRTTNTCGTLSHSPPELLRYGRMSPAADTYAFGVMMWEVYMNQVAFRKLHYGQFFETVVLRNQRPPIPPDMPEDYRLLLESCWAADPADRPGVDQLLQCLGLMIQARDEAAAAAATAEAANSPTAAGDGVRAAEAAAGGLAAPVHDAGLELALAAAQQQQQQCCISGGSNNNSSNSRHAGGCAAATSSIRATDSTAGTNYVPLGGSAGGISSTLSTPQSLSRLADNSNTPGVVAIKRQTVLVTEDLVFPQVNQQQQRHRQQQWHHHQQQQQPWRQQQQQQQQHAEHECSLESSDFIESF